MGLVTERSNSQVSPKMVCDDFLTLFMHCYIWCLRISFLQFRKHEARRSDLEAEIRVKPQIYCNQQYFYFTNFLLHKIVRIITYNLLFAI